MLLKYFILFLRLLHLLYCDEEKLTPTNCVKSSVFFGDFTDSDDPGVRFYLYTRKNFNYAQELEISNRRSFLRSNFNPSWPVRIFIHGWRGEHRSCACAIVKDAYLKNNNFNVIIVDWSDYSDTKLKEASKNVKTAGEELAEFTKALNHIYCIPYNNIYLIGHSLGAHVAGHAGSVIYPNKYNTIFGLDPAAPFFLGENITKRLDPSDAEYVESIGTDLLIAGYDSPELGDASIYPNYGSRVQPGCTKLKVSDPFCSHRIVVHYFAESILFPKSFCALPTTWRKLNEIGSPTYDSFRDINNHCEYYMGGEPSTPKYGVFFVETKKRYYRSI